MGRTRTATTMTVALALFAAACGGSASDVANPNDAEPSATPVATEVPATSDESADAAEDGTEAETPTATAEPTSDATPTPLATPEPAPTTAVEPPPSGELTGIEDYLLRPTDLPDLDATAPYDYEPGEVVSSGCEAFDTLVVIEARGRQISFTGATVDTVDSAATAHVSVENARRVIDTARRVSEECRQLDLDGVVVDIRPLVVPAVPDGSAGFELGLGSEFLSIGFFRSGTVVVLTNVAPSAAAGPILRLQADRILAAAGGDTGDAGPLDLTPLALDPATIGPGWEQDSLSTEITADEEAGPCGVAPPPALPGFEAEYSGPSGEELLQLTGLGRAEADAWVSSFEGLAGCIDELDGASFTGATLDVAPPAGADRSVVTQLVLGEGDVTETLVFAVSRYGDFVIALGWFAPESSAVEAGERLVEFTEATATRLPN